MQPIVYFCGSPIWTYQLSKYLTNVQKPLTDESRHKLQSTENFIGATKAIQIPDDHKLMSFDVRSPFNRIPLQLALDCTENATKQSIVELPLPTDKLSEHVIQNRESISRERVCESRAHSVLNQSSGGFICNIRV